MNVVPVALSLENPVFHTYMLAATIMILKLMIQPWITVQRMMKVRAGFRSPEDIKKTPMNPEPSALQLEINEYVDRSRRMNLNDLESIPGFVGRWLLFRTFRTATAAGAGIDLDIRCRKSRAFRGVCDCADT